MAEFPELWRSAQEFQQLQSSAEDLLRLWQVVGVSIEAQDADAKAILAAALETCEGCCSRWNLRRAELEKECQELDIALRKSLQELAEGSFAEELRRANDLALQPRATELKGLVQAASGAWEEQEQLRRDLAEACAAMGLDSSLINVEQLTPEQLQKEVQRRKEQVQQQLEEMAMALGLDPEDFQLEDLASMAAKLKDFQTELSSLKDTAIQNACRARDIWVELRLAPQLLRDQHAAELSEAHDAPAVTAAVGAAVRRSLDAWEAQREEAVKEAESVHQLIRGHAAPPEAEAFLAEHSGLHQEDLERCRSKVQDLRRACRDAEKPIRQHLRQLYHQTGCALENLEACYQEVEQSGTSRQRKKILEKETRRIEDYKESVSAILGQREELKALVLAGESFERQAQAGPGRWVGSSKHFLEEEKFRKRFLKQYPLLRDKIIESIEEWEGSNEKIFTHKGIGLGDRLRELRDHPVALASAKGDLSIMGRLASPGHSTRVPGTKQEPTAGEDPHEPQ
ncbi:unnamed protein product [Durusdinium trenchii]|uniref:Ankyrin repeat domain-containing protein 17 n=2 Tax=Durusdinium trenchii TaxID=1381693 RepID=A0ABP0M2B3_9DINO